MMRNDWIEVELGEVCDVVMGQSPPSSTYNIEGRGLPFFQGKAEFTDLHPVVQRWCDTPKRTAQPFDILLSVRAPVGSTNIANTKCAIGRGLAAITYRPEHKYIWYYLRLIEKKLDEQGTGTTFKAISGGILKSQRVSLAPLPEQRAIVSKIEQLFSELDGGIANLKAAKKKLEIYRQAVLKRAFEGELTKEWRDKHKDLPAAEDLLEQIKKERQAYYDCQMQEWAQAIKEWETNPGKGKKPGKPKKIKNLPKLSKQELAELAKLPSKWICDIHQ
jgi:type I restriction enzyme S subunit